MLEELPEDLRQSLKTLKSGECAVTYDSKRRVLIGICNKDGKLEVTTKRIDEILKTRQVKK